MTTVLVAGSTGAVGSALVPQLKSAGFDVIPHVRPKTAERHPLGKDANALICDLSDAPKLDAAMSRLDGEVLRRSVTDVEAEISAAAEAQRAAKKQARKELRERRQVEHKAQIDAKIEELKSKLHSLHIAGTPSG